MIVSSEMLLDLTDIIFDDYVIIWYYHSIPATYNVIERNLQQQMHVNNDIADLDVVCFSPK